MSDKQNTSNIPKEQAENKENQDKNAGDKKKDALLDKEEELVRLSFMLTK
jgi:hypothetical protein